MTIIVKHSHPEIHPTESERCHTFERRIEDRMNDLLDLVIETAKASEYEIDVSGIEEIKASKRFDNKAEFAGKILPPHLKPGGHNPFDILHDLFSEGVHSMTEEDCIDQFDKTKERLSFSSRT